jgi:hypothetical protein
MGKSQNLFGSTNVKVIGCNIPNMNTNKKTCRTRNRFVEIHTRRYDISDLGEVFSF